MMLVHYSKKKVYVTLSLTRVFTLATTTAPSSTNPRKNFVVELVPLTTKYSLINKNKQNKKKETLNHENQ